MTKLLDLDVLATQARAVSLRGVEYPVREMSVGDFVELQKLMEVVESAADGATPQAQLDAMIKMITYLLPDMPAEVVCSLNDKQMTKLLEFVSDSEDGSEGK